eukprot:23858_5
MTGHRTATTVVMMTMMMTLISRPVGKCPRIRYVSKHSAHSAEPQNRRNEAALIQPDHINPQDVSGHCFPHPATTKSLV